MQPALDVCARHDAGDGAVHYIKEQQYGREHDRIADDLQVCQAAAHHVVQAHADERDRHVHQDGKYEGQKEIQRDLRYERGDRLFCRRAHEVQLFVPPPVFGHRREAFERQYRHGKEGEGERDEEHDQQPRRRQLAQGGQEGACDTHIEEGTVSVRKVLIGVLFVLLPEKLVHGLLVEGAARIVDRAQRLRRGVQAALLYRVCDRVGDGEQIAEAEHRETLVRGRDALKRDRKIIRLPFEAADQLFGVLHSLFELFERGAVADEQRAAL